MGKWLKENGEAVHGALDAAPGTASACGDFSRKVRRVYFWVRHWPGEDFGLGGFTTRLESARLLVSDENIAFRQEGPRIILKGLPKESPDRWAGVTVIELTFAEAPVHLRHLTTPAFTVQ